jgi:uncharacterized protein YjbI with pentapeptide repeats
MRSELSEYQYIGFSPSSNLFQELILGTFTVTVMVFALSYGASASSNYEDCQGRYKNGTMPRKADLELLLKAHLDWLSNYRGKQLTDAQLFDGRKANFCNANLQPPVPLKGADLTSANLRGASFQKNDLSGTVLEGADLAQANMRMTTLEGARLNHGIGVDFTRARLQQADLSNGHFYHSDFTEAVLHKAKMADIHLENVKLNGAQLQNADLTSSRLESVDLTGSWLQGTDFSKSTLVSVNFANARMEKTNVSKAVIQRGSFDGTFFEPVGADTLLILDASGLSTIKFQDPRPIVQLRKNIKEAGLWNEERALTSALRKFELSNASRVEQISQKYLLGGLITDYGAYPWRSVKYLISFIPMFALFYSFAIGLSSKAAWRRSGIWAVWPEGSIYKEDPARVGARFFHRKFLINIVFGSLFFSLVSAFHIGWRDLNVGTWITRLQPREYSLRATGWVRFVSGVQSLLSVYLLALWLLTYFSRPFE